MYEYFSERDYAKDFPYTDLATERRRADVDLKGVDFKREAGLYGSWERIRITSPEGARCIGRPMGIYDTLLTERMDLIVNKITLSIIMELTMHYVVKQY